MSPGSLTPPAGILARFVPVAIIFLPFILVWVSAIAILLPRLRDRARWVSLSLWGFGILLGSGLIHLGLQFWIISATCHSPDHLKHVAPLASGIGLANQLLQVAGFIFLIIAILSGREGESSCKPSQSESFPG